MLALGASATSVGAEKLGGEAFLDPCVVRQPLPSGWIQRPIVPEAESQHADLVISLDQQLYRYLLPLIDDYAQEHGLTIAVKKVLAEFPQVSCSASLSTSGAFVARLQTRTAYRACASAPLPSRPSALLVRPDNPAENITLSQAQSLFRGELTDGSTVIEPAGPAAAQSVHPVVRLHCKLRPGQWRLLLDNEELFSPDLLDVGAIEDTV